MLSLSSFNFMSYIWIINFYVDCYIEQEVQSVKLKSSVYGFSLFTEAFIEEGFLTECKNYFLDFILPSDKCLLLHQYHVILLTIAQ